MVFRASRNLLLLSAVSHHVAKVMERFTIMEISCPVCRTILELPEHLPEGQHLQCSECRKKFVVHNGSTMPLTLFDKQQARNHSIDLVPKIPGITVAGIIILYLINGWAILSELKNEYHVLYSSVFKISYSALIIAFAILAHRGKSWARIVVTSLLGPIVAFSALLLFFPSVVPIILTLFLLVLFSLPIVFLWAPSSNRWYTAKKVSAT